MFDICDMGSADNQKMTIRLKDLEQAKICNVLLHSAPQMILQLSIYLRLNDYFWIQTVSILVHLIYIVISTSSFYFTRRPQPLYAAFQKTKIYLYPAFTFIVCIRIASFALMFAYAKTHITVAFIVFFGISLMALYYDQHLENDPIHSNFEQLLNILLPVFVPCIKGLTKNFHIVTTICTVAMHFVCQLILLINVSYLQMLSVPNFPHALHCYTKDKVDTYKSDLKMKNSTTNTFDDTHLHYCVSSDYFDWFGPNSLFLFGCIGILFLLLLEVLFNFLFNRNWKTYFRNVSSLSSPSISLSV